MMDVHQQRMCELQGEVFERSTSCFACSSSYFVSHFMRSKCAKMLDQDEYLSSESILDQLEKSYPSLAVEGKIKYDAAIMHWVGYLYRAYVIKKKKRSTQIHASLKLERIIPLYEAFHTMDVEYAVDRISELLGDDLPKDEYQVYKTIFSKRKK